jgi:hypothetical protein
MNERNQMKTATIGDRVLVHNLSGWWTVTITHITTSTGVFEGRGDRGYSAPYRLCDIVREETYSGLSATGEVL